MHVLWEEGAPVPAPRTITEDDAGARALADLYAAPADGRVVRAMMNTTLDGAVVGEDGTSGTLRNPVDSLVFAVSRALADVVLVGAGTVRVEDYTDPGAHPALGPGGRRPGDADRPTLAVLTGSGDLPPGFAPRWPLLVLAPPGAGPAVSARSGVPADRVLEVDGPAAALRALRARGARTVQLEGGPSTLGRFLAEGLVDELCLTVTHRSLGGHSPRTVTGDGHDADWALSSLVVGPGATLTRYRRDGA